MSSDTATTRSTFRVGDRVQWSAYDQPQCPVNIGEVVAVVPAGADPRAMALAAQKEWGTTRLDLGTTLPRDHESYLVVVGQAWGLRKRYKSKLYWPRVARLRPVP
jgi:hypothetical protein